MADSNHAQFKLHWSTWTGIPDVLFDHWLGILTGAQLKVVLYVCRHSYGYHRGSARISESRFLEGTITRDGRRLDWGAGVKRDALKESLATLIELGLLCKQRRYGVQGGNESNEYSLDLTPPDESMPSKSLEMYRGAPRLAFTQVPNIVFDEALPHLNGSSLKVLLFILRWTRGKKESLADITKAQMHAGIVTDAGKVYGGTGLSRRSIDGAVKDLLDKSIIFDETGTVPSGNPAPTRYGLVIDDMAGPPPAKNQPSPPQKTEQGGDAKNRPTPPQKTSHADRKKPTHPPAENPLHEIHVLNTHERHGEIPTMPPSHLYPFSKVTLESRQIWRTVLDELKGLSPQEASAIANSRILTREGNEVVVGVTTEYAARLLQSRLADMVGESLSTLGRETVKVRFCSAARG